jgi:NADH-quinone oxidoreductase subunit J
VAQLFFWYLAGVILVSAILVVALRNPVHSVLSLLIMFFHVAGLYITLHAEFLAAVQIIVYAGAILVLYLFVLMLLNVKREERYHTQWLLGTLAGVTILTEGFALVAQYGLPAPSATPQAAAPLARALESSQGNTEAIGAVLYAAYIFPFEVASLILLVAMVGAIVLAKREVFERRES